MIVLDTDSLTLFFRNHPRVCERLREAPEEVAITIISRIETLQGRFATLLKAADSAELERGQQRLDQAERDLARIPKVLAIDAAAAAEFERLRGNKKLKKIGRADLLIAAITLANKATLVTRNLKHFREVPGLPVENWAD
ncbi:MAG TPA: PIN domain-containing protein [Gemmataceae bacterium]|nr:PIN domain-containing protein [Gemmataceae bacterium]